MKDLNDQIDEFIDAIVENPTEEEVTVLKNKARKLVDERIRKVKAMLEKNDQALIDMENDLT